MRAGQGSQVKIKGFQRKVPKSMFRRFPKLPGTVSDRVCRSRFLRFPWMQVPTNCPSKGSLQKTFRQGSQVTQSWFPQDFQVKVPTKDKFFQERFQSKSWQGSGAGSHKKVKVALAKYPTRFPSKVSQVEVPK